MTYPLESIDPFYAACLKLSVPPCEEEPYKPIYVRLPRAPGTERVSRTHPQRVRETHLFLENGHFGQGRQFRFHSDVRVFLVFIDSRKR
jgi:hypothetical protein